MTQTDDLFWMQKAIEQAQIAYRYNEVPVGAIVVRDNHQFISGGYNQTISRCDPSAHAEIMALRAAAKNLNNYRLSGTTLYATLEPCAMCVGAMMHARIKRLVFAAPEPKSGAVISQYCLTEQYYNHRISYTCGVLSEASVYILRSFFREKRQMQRNNTIVRTIIRSQQNGIALEDE